MPRAQRREGTEGITNESNAVVGIERTPWVDTKVGVGLHIFVILTSRRSPTNLQIMSSLARPAASGKIHWPGPKTQKHQIR